MDLQHMLHSHTNPDNKPALKPQTLRTPYHDKIEALDLEPIKFKLVKEKGWPLQKADSVEKLYKAYLLLFALYPCEEHVPTPDIDEMWHSHILDTYKYMADCHDIFGFYLHHYPYLGMLGTEDAALATAQFAATRKRFQEIAGLDPVSAADCGGGGGCGGGGSSCSSSSCSSSGGGDSGGHSDPGPGHHESGYVPIIIPSCSSTGNSNIPSKPLKDEWKKKKEKPQTPANNNPSPAQEKKKPFWKRIFKALRRKEETAVKEPTRWERSVDPRLMRKKGRPTRAELLALLAETDGETATKH